MKLNAVTITIANPCHQNWEELQAAERGRYCGACQKVVTDFTMMTDAEVLATIRQTRAEGACGRFALAQTNRPLITSTERHFAGRRIVNRFVAVLVIIHSLTNTATAQQVKITTEQHDIKDKKPADTARKYDAKALKKLEHEIKMKQVTTGYYSPKPTRWQRMTTIFRRKQH